MPTDLPRNPEVADQFDLLADLMEIDGADGFRIAAYRRAATSIRESAASVAQLALDGKATALPEGHLEPGEVRPPQTLLLRAVQHPHGLVLAGEPVRDLAGPVRGAVVHHEDRVRAPGCVELLERGAHDRLEVLGLVVGRQDEPGSRQSGA